MSTLVTTLFPKSVVARVLIWFKKIFWTFFFIFFDMIEPTGTYLVFTLIFCDPKPTQILKKKIFKKLGSKLDLVSSQWNWT